jgi:hypothetical protein
MTSILIMARLSILKLACDHVKYQPPMKLGAGQLAVQLCPLQTHRKIAWAMGENTFIS